MKQIPRRVTQPNWLAPMLAALTNQYFSDRNWIYERKLDGMRCLLYKKNNVIKIWSRNKKIQNDVFPELVKALKKYNSDFILDSEVVAFAAGRQTSFEKLQLRMHVQNPPPALIKKVPITAYVFDILYLNGYKLCALPLLQRKQILKENFQFTKPMQYLPHRKTNGLEYFAYACQHGWEGVIAKKSDSPYLHRRSTDWLKFKCAQGQEFVIGGYTRPRGSRLKFGALLIGYYKNGVLKYAGKVGTGFDVATLLMLYQKLHALETKTSPFTDYQKNSKSIVWVKPQLVAQLSFTEWTADGKLRHPCYVGLRNDKAATQIRREQPK